MRKALFGSMPESSALQNLIALCYDSIGYEQPIVATDIEEQLTDIMGAHLPVQAIFSSCRTSDDVSKVDDVQDESQSHL
jgi:hypothetical protein